MKKSLVKVEYSFFNTNRSRSPRASDGYLYTHSFYTPTHRRARPEVRDLRFIPAPRSFQAYEATNSPSELEINPVVAYPNPADSYTTLRYELFRAHPQTFIRIFDVSGRMIQSFDLGDAYEGQVLWDTRDERSGMYFYQLWQNEEKVSAGKIVVQH